MAHRIVIFGFDFVYFKEFFNGFSFEAYGSSNAEGVADDNHGEYETDGEGAIYAFFEEDDGCEGDDKRGVGRRHATSDNEVVPG